MLPFLSFKSFGFGFGFFDVWLFRAVNRFVLDLAAFADRNIRRVCIARAALLAVAVLVRRMVIPAAN